MGFPLRNPSLFTLKFLIVLKLERKERGITEGITHFIYGVISVRFKF